MKKIVLVACAAGKAAKATAAKDLYQSQLFGLTRQFAEQNGEAWYILSAKHGLVHPEATIHPYDQTLNDMTSPLRFAWALSVAEQIDALQLQGADITILAGRNYRDFLMPMLEARGHRVRVPMEGLGIGKQLQYMTRELAA